MGQRGSSCSCQSGCRQWWMAGPSDLPSIEAYSADSDIVHVEAVAVSSMQAVHGSKSLLCMGVPQHRAAPACIYLLPAGCTPAATLLKIKTADVGAG